MTNKAQKSIIHIYRKGGRTMPETLKTTEAQRKAVYNYDEKFERVNCRLAKGTKDRIKALKYSANDFIKLAVAEKLEREEKILK